MDFSLTEDQALLADMVARLFEREYDPQTRRHLAADPAFVAPGHWDKMAELGLLGIFVPEAQGGSAENDNDSFSLMVLIARILGSKLVAEPFVSSAVVAASVIADGANAALRQACLPRIASGALRIAVAVEPWSDEGFESLPRAARGADGGLVVAGRATVIDPEGSESLLLPVWDSAQGGLAIALIDRESAGLAPEAGRTLDGTGRLRLRMEGVHVPAARIVAGPGRAETVWQRAIQRATVALCFEAVGGMETLLAMTADYMKTRKQYGRYLSQFQALQHDLADMRSAIEQATSASFAAMAACLNNEPAEAARTVSAAKYLVGKHARRVGEQAVQIHAGIAMTDEFAVGHHFRRLLAIDALWGNAESHLDARVRALSAPEQGAAA